jgi:hypothetical protein
MFDFLLFPTFSKKSGVFLVQSVSLEDSGQEIKKGQSENFLVLVLL